MKYLNSTSNLVILISTFTFDWYNLLSETNTMGTYGFFFFLKKGKRCTNEWKCRGNNFYDIFQCIRQVYITGKKKKAEASRVLLPRRSFANVGTIFRYWYSINIARKRRQWASRNVDIRNEMQHGRSYKTRESACPGSHSLCVFFRWHTEKSLFNICENVRFKKAHRRHANVIKTWLVASFVI